MRRRYVKSLLPLTMVLAFVSVVLLWWVRPDRGEIRMGWEPVPDPGPFVQAPDSSGDWKPALSNDQQSGDVMADNEAPLQASGAVPPSDSRLTAGEDEVCKDQAVDAWDTLIESIVGRETIDIEAESLRVRQALGNIDPSLRLQSLQMAINLLPDEHFPVLYGILLDKSLPADLLEVIFDDALNRSEELKIPMMEFLRKDRDHPCFFEAARILDIITDDV